MERLTCARCGETSTSYTQETELPKSGLTLLTERCGSGCRGPIKFKIQGKLEHESDCWWKPARCAGVIQVDLNEWTPENFPCLSCNSDSASNQAWVEVRIPGIDNYGDSCELLISWECRECGTRAVANQFSFFIHQDGRGHPPSGSIWRQT